MKKGDDKIKINANMIRKEPRQIGSECIVEDVVELSQSEFRHFQNHLLESYDWLNEYKNKMYVDSNDKYHCILVLGKNIDDGILVESEGSDYARYSALVSNARLIVENQKQELEENNSLREITREELDVIYAKHMLWTYGVEGGECANLPNCKFQNMSMEEMQFNGAKFNNCKFINTNIDNSGFCFAELKGTVFENCSAKLSAFEEADLEKTQFILCDLSNTSMMHSNLSDATITDCDLNCVCFDNCKLTDAKINIPDAIENGATFYNIENEEQDFDESSGPAFSM